MPSSKSATKPRRRTRSGAEPVAVKTETKRWEPKIVPPRSVVYQQTLEEAFPAVDPGLRPYGSRVLVQLRQPPKKSAGGILLTIDTQDTEKWNTVVGKLVAIGPGAFRNRDTLQLWPEGEWAKVGQYLWCPKYGGQRHEPKIPGTDERAHFVVFDDLNLIGDYTIDPRDVMAFL